jgi:hypothetical protein
MKAQFYLIGLLILVLPSQSQSPDCLTAPNSVGLPNGTNGCICFSGFVWNGTACAAAPTNPPAANTTTTTTVTTVTTAPAFNCTGIPYALAPNGTTGCICQRGFDWNAPNCFRNCTIIANSMQANSGIDACLCMNGFNWNGSNCVGTAAPIPTPVPG